MADFCAGFPPGHYRQFPKLGRPPFRVGQLWQRDAMDTWRVIAATDDGAVGTLRLEAYAGRRNDSGRMLSLYRRNWPTAASWVCVPEVRLAGGEVLT